MLRIKFVDIKILSKGIIFISNLMVFHLKEKKTLVKNLLQDIWLNLLNIHYCFRDFSQFYGACFWRSYQEHLTISSSPALAVSCEVQTGKKS